jgi:hypothetical protein
MKLWDGTDFEHLRIPYYVHNRRDSTAMDAYLLLIPYAMGLRLSPAV